MDHFTKTPEAHSVPNQETSTVAEAIVINFFCRFGEPQGLYSDQGGDFYSHLIQEVLQCLGVTTTGTKSLHQQSDCMVERYIKTVKHLREVVSSHQRDWKARLPIFLLDYMTSTHGTTGLTPASLVFGTELRLPCDLLLGAPTNEKRPTIDPAAYLVDHLHDIHNYAPQHLKLASDQMKTCHDWPTVWATTRALKCGSIAQAPNLMGVPHKVVTQINDVVYRIQRNPSWMLLAYLDQLAPYQQTAQDERL
jgi:hypothetical protein